MSSAKKILAEYRKLGWRPHPHKLALVKDMGFRRFAELDVEELLKGTVNPRTLEPDEVQEWMLH